MVAPTFDGTAYDAVEKIWGRALAGDLDALADVETLLNKAGVHRRRDDGTLRQINLSRPTSKTDVLIVGLRYVKRDTTQTEDHFVFDRHSTEIGRCYARSLEARFVEYYGTHKAQVDLTRPVSIPPTFCNTITLNIQVTT